MAFRKDDNRSKYTAQELAAIRQAEAEQMSAADDYLASCKAKYTERKAVVVSGLVKKYGFSQDGAERVAILIAKGENVYGERALDSAKFANGEMKAAAQRAYEFYWKN